MHKKFYFHPSLYLVKHTAFSLSYVTIFICWLIPALLKGDLQYYRMDFIYIALIVSSSILIFLYILKKLFFRFKNTCYILTEDAIIKRNHAIQTTINFSNISQVSYKHTSLSMRYFLIRSKEKEIEIPLIINHCHKIISTILDNITQTNTNQIYSESNMEAGKHRAIVDEYNLNQSSLLLEPLILWASLFMVFGFCTGLYLWGVHVVIAALWSIISITFPLIAFLITYMHETRKKLFYLKETQNIYIAEANIEPYKITLFYTMLCYLFAGIIFKNIWPLFFF